MTEVKGCIDYKDLTDEQKTMVDSTDESLRRKAAHNGWGLDKLVKDDEKWVRVCVVSTERNQVLDILVHDPDDDVRNAVAECGRPQDLDILVHDDSSYVRGEVAAQGRDKDLDVLVHDEDTDVRKEVVWIGRPQDLEILKDDEEEYIRNEVIKLQASLADRGTTAKKTSEVGRKGQEQQPHDLRVER